MMNIRQVKLGEILHERYVRLKPDEAANLGLKRIEKIDFSGAIVISDKPTNTDMILVKDGDFVMSGINAAKGAISVFHGSEDVLATIHYSAYQFDESEIEVEYLKFLLKSEYFLNKLRQEVPGGMKTELKAKHLLPLQINLPDLDTQKSIVSRLRELQALHAQANATLARLQADVKRLRQSILQQAIQGKLVDNTLPLGEKTGAELLADIRAEKERRAREQGKKPDKPLPPVTEAEMPFELPEGWVWCRLGEVFFVTKLAGFEFTNYIRLTEVGEIPAVRAQNVKPGRLIEENLLYIDKKTSLYLQRSALDKPALLITFIGAGIGEVAVFDKKERWHLAPNVAKAERLSNLISLEYVMQILNSNFGKEEFFKAQKITAQPSLSMGTIREVLLPLPPPYIQTKMISEIERQFLEYSKFELLLSTTANQLNRLWQSEMQQIFKFENAS